MRISLRFVVTLVPVLVLVILGFFLVMNRWERQWVKHELSNRAQLITSGLVSSWSNGESPAVLRRLQEIVGEKTIEGAAICRVVGGIPEITRGRISSEACRDLATQASYVESGAGELFRSVVPLEAGADPAWLVVFQNPSEFSARHGLLTRRYAATLVLLLGLILGAITLVLYRWSAPPVPEVHNLDHVLLDMRRAKRGSGLEAPGWTAERLRNEVQRLFGDSRLCIVANREPYIHNRKGKRIETQFPASGLVTAVEPIVRACAGLWIGHGSGTADRETSDRNGVLLVPPGKPEYALKRVWLSKEEEAGYYYGFSNEGLWPLCHIAHTRPSFRPEDWEHYRRVNEKFAAAFDEQMKAPGPIALIQDYHFALLPQYLRERRPDAVTSLFWHIPWPNPEAIQICPWKKELLQGMLGADLIGFHIQNHCNNFLDSVDAFLEARVDREEFSVTIQGHTCYVKPFPISVEWPSRFERPAEDIPGTRARLFTELGLHKDTVLAIGVDRLDYTKGIVERMLAVEKLLETHPKWTGRFVFVQIAAPSRTQIPRYQELEAQVRGVVARINNRFGRRGYTPVQLRIAHHDAGEVFRFYAAADLCMVSSLHDGMNLVAKEFISARTDEGGALILSSFTGAARELSEAFIVNPYDVLECATAIHQALVMSPEERRDRMQRLRARVAEKNVYAWAAGFLGEVRRLNDMRRTAAGVARVS